MGRHYGYRRRSWTYSNASDSKKSILQSLFGEIVLEIESAFLHLESYELEALFMDYGCEYGKNAETYARRTYENWKSGRTKVSGVTAERLLELLPRNLPAKERYDLVKKLRAKYIHKHSEYITISPENWRDTVNEAVSKVLMKSREFQLPGELFERATWLSNGDVEAALRLLHAAEEDEARLRVAFLEAEFKRLEVLVANISDTNSVSHRITLPQGDIHTTIQVRKRSFWEKPFGANNGGTRMKYDEKEIIKKDPLEKPLVKPASNNNLLNMVANDLSPEERMALRNKILDEKLKLDVSQQKADQRFDDSTRDMANTVRAVNALEQSSKSDYEV
ncbi:MAG: hypothetical protein AABZ47_04445 [Planctomycetota bacterium]